MGYPETKYCKHCQKNHPFNENHYFLNGGLLRKCKKFYSAYEAARHKAKVEKKVWTKEMYRAVQQSVRESDNS